MSQNHSARPFVFMPWYLIALILVIIFSTQVSCKSCWNKKEPTQKPGAKVEKMGWNLLFLPGTNKHSRDSIITEISTYVKSFYDSINTANGTNFPLTEDVVFCPCDTLLYNYNFTFLDGSGSSVGTSPTKPKGPAGSGDNIGAFVSDNIVILDSLPKIDTPDFKGTAVVKNIPFDLTKKLAIIDSGIDTTLFSNKIQNLIWSEPMGSTMFNFLPHQPLKDFSDRTIGKHGSAVAAIAIKAMGNISKYPKVMILKALDENNRGSIFSVSCALSYAIQKKASLINLSLGYFGPADSILKHYLKLCATPNDTIQVFVAAGNTPGSHNLNLCQENNGNMLNSSRLFYPACFSEDFRNVTSVTQISKFDSACYYQNYSNEFINLGVYDKSNCCATKVDFQINHIQYYEGSSFVTPVASGIRMLTLMDPGTQNWDNMIKVDPRKRVTIEGHYIEYSSNE